MPVADTGTTKAWKGHPFATLEHRKIFCRWAQLKLPRRWVTLRVWPPFMDWPTCEAWLSSQAWVDHANRGAGPERLVVTSLDPVPEDEVPLHIREALRTALVTARLEGKV